MLSLRHPNLPCIYSQKIFLPLIYSTASSQKNLLLASTCTPWVPIFLGATEVSYFGHILSDKGVQTDPKKVAAIQEMEPPKNRQELEALLGMVNYLAKFTPNLAETTAPKRNLLKKYSEFVWDC